MHAKRSNAEYGFPLSRICIVALLAVAVTLLAFFAGRFTARVEAEPSGPAPVGDPQVLVSTQGHESCDSEARFSPQLRALSDEIAALRHLLAPSQRQTLGDAPRAVIDPEVALRVREELAVQLSTQAQRRDLAVAVRAVQKRHESEQWSAETRTQVAEVLAAYIRELRLTIYGDASFPMTTPASGTADYSKWQRAQNDATQRTIERLAELVPTAPSHAKLLADLTPEPFWGVIEGH